MSSAPQKVVPATYDSISPPVIAAKASVERRYDMVKIRYTRNILGMRIFPLPSKHKYRFDASPSNREKIVPRYDADELMSRYPNTFEIIE